MRILLTGASGQVGGALVSRLSAYDVIACRRSDLDLSEPYRIASALDQIGPDLIINPAAYTAVDKANDEPDLAYRINAVAPAAMARWAAPRKVPLIHFSTDCVFDGSGTFPWKESDTPRPLSVYGATKLAGEEAIRNLGGDFLVVRTSWVYAAQGKNFLRTIARLAREKKELRIVADQIGAPTSAAVIAEGIASMIAGGLEAFRARCVEANGLVHLATEGGASWHDFAVAIVAGLRARQFPLAVKHIQAIRTEDYPTPAARPRNSRLDLSRLRQVFGIAPKPWEEALNVELDHFSMDDTG